MKEADVQIAHWAGNRAVLGAVVFISAGLLLLYGAARFYLSESYGGPEEELALLKYLFWIDRSGGVLGEDNIELYVEGRAEPIVEAGLSLILAAWLLWLGATRIIRFLRRPG